MSDRERCGDCKHCEAFKYVWTCTYSVPYWALPNPIVEPMKLITCPTYEERPLNERIEAINQRHA